MKAHMKTILVAPLFALAMRAQAEARAPKLVKPA